MIARGKVQEELPIEGTDVRVDGAPAAPIVAGAEHGIGGVLLEMHAVVRYGVADGIPLPVAIGLIEEMHPAAQHDGRGRADAVLLAFVRYGEFARVFPCLHIA